MINFFRKIRKQFADDNKPLKYMRYAVGEIVLVVIGILFALQVNTWNEGRKQNNNGLNVLIKLEKEFIENQTMLKGVLPIHKRTEYSCSRLLELIDLHPTQFKWDSLGYYVNDLIFIPKYTPNKSVLNSVIASGDINFINNEDITYKITNWNGKIEEYNYWISIVSSITIDQIIPFTVKYFPFRNMKAMKRFEYFFKATTLSKHDVDQNRILTSMEFENLVELRKLVSIQLRVIVDEIQNEQAEIIRLIKTELENN